MDVKVWLAGGVTDMRRGMNGLTRQLQEGLGRDPHAGDLFCFRGRTGSLLKIVWHDGVGLSLYSKRLEHGRFIVSALYAPLALGVDARPLNSERIRRHRELWPTNIANGHLRKPAPRRA
ncbi:IS66 family insertion sequence element accessory protein TnpB [Rhodovibrio salinarum]|nr:IS66 family insertion sequence element accessory protein TnpB [Rhodovibrio salinarum]